MRCVMGVNVLVVNNELPIKTVAELVDYAKKNPGKLNFSEASASQRLSGEMFNQLAGVKIERVPYKSSPQALSDVISGQVQVMFPDLPQGLTQIGRAACAAWPSRAPSAPQSCPTCRRSPRRCRATRWSTGSRCSRRRRTPKPIQQKLFDAIAEAIKDPATAKAMTQGRMEISPSSASTSSRPT